MTVAEADPGVDFSLSEEQLLVQEQVRRFAEERIAPGEAERDREHRFPAEIVAELAEMGLLGVMVPEELGGAGLDALTYTLIIEELSRVSPSVGVTVSVTNSVCCWPIVRFASDELKRRVLPDLAAGGELGAFALTEPGAGSDPASLAARALRDGDGWRLEGEKSWITNAGIARWYVVFARTDPAAGKRGISAFVVPSDAPGLEVGAAESKVGLRASRTSPLVLDGCRVPAANLLGAEGQGLKIALATLDHSRLGIAAQALGMHQRALDLAVGYARERVQFGVPIARHQAIQLQIAEIATALAAGRTLTHHAARASERPGSEAGRLASEAKVFTTEAANRGVWLAQQIHGGNGFSEEYEIGRLYRDVRVTTIYEGTSEMQRLVIARHLLRR